jgi:hypothetical protein
MKTRKECTNLNIIPNNDNLSNSQEHEYNSIESIKNIQISIKNVNKKERTNKTTSVLKKSNTFKKFLTKYSLSQNEIEQLKKQREYYEKIDNIKLNIETMVHQC